MLAERYIAKVYRKGISQRYIAEGISQRCIAEVYRKGISQRYIAEGISQRYIAKGISQGCLKGIPRFRDPLFGHKSVVAKNKDGDSPSISHPAGLGQRG